MPVITVAAAVVLTKLIQQEIQPATGALFFAAVLVSALYGGTGPGLLSAILAALANDYYFTPPLYAIKLSGANLIRLTVFMFATLLISLLGGRQKRLMSEQSRLMNELKDQVKERQKSREHRKALLHRLVTAQEEERQRISRELHDQMGQYITALMWGLELLKNSQQIPTQERDYLEQMHQITRQIDLEVDHLALELRPAILDDLGLYSALVQHFERIHKQTRLPIYYRIDGIILQRLYPEAETSIYRVVQEAITNVLKHAKAKHVSITMEKRGDHLIIVIEDNGCGFDTERLERSGEVNSKLGLLGMQERVAMLDGTLTIESTPGSGTTLFVRIPIAP
jgi:signal transduction histidine kinase